MRNIKNSKEFEDLKANKILVEQAITEVYGEYLNATLISKASNLIAIDHNYRLNLIPNIETHIKICLHNLEKYIQKKHIENSDFGQAMSLFVASITEYKETNDDEILHKSENIVIDNIINHFYPDIDSEMIEEMRTILSSLMKDVGPKQTLNFISINPISFRNKVENVAMQTGAVKTQELNNIAESIKRSSHAINKTLGKAAQIASAFISAGPITASIGLGAVGIASLIALPIAAAVAADDADKNLISKSNINLNFTDRYKANKDNTISSINDITQTKARQNFFPKKGGHMLGK